MLPTTASILAAVALLSGAVSAGCLGTTAVIDSGTLIGTATSLPSASATVNKFLGVPFAAPPVRFSPPQPAPAFNGVYNATAWQASCLQQFVYPPLAQYFTEAIFDVLTVPESEDCLYLNVYAPSSAPPQSGRAVMIWIYGGSLQFGTAGQAAYDGSAFAAYQDVIVVSANYRTNVFGFPSAPELPLTGHNLGFLDQHAAIDWVQRNIHAFGGDPTKVTLVGESAGAFSIDALLTSPLYLTNPPFRGAILESGQISYNGYSRAPVPSSWTTLTTALGCNSTTSNLTCVRNAPATTIKTIIEQNSLAFNPWADNTTMVANIAAARQGGRFAKVPVLAGTNAQEGRIFEFGQSDVNALLQSYFSITNAKNIPALQAHYAVGNITGYNTGYDQVSQLFTDFIFQCPAALWTNETAAQGVPTWRYYFNATFANTQDFPNAGVFHTSEYEIVFQTYPGGPVNTILTAEPTRFIPTNLPPNAQEVALSAFMNGAWGAFIKNPASGPGWNKLGTFPADGDVAALGSNGTAGVTIIKQASIDSVCSLFVPAYRLFTGPVFGLGTSLG